MAASGGWRVSPHRAAGLTLIELLVSIALVVTLAGLFIGTLGYVNKKSARSRAEAEVAALSAAVDSYRLDFGSYPAVTNLFRELTGQGAFNTNKVYFEPTPTMVMNRNMTNGPFVDPWGKEYQYKTNDLRNVGFFDLYTVPPDAQDEKDWIHN